MKKRITIAAGTLSLLLVFLFAPGLPVGAATPAYYSADITLDLQRDGSALVTEVWDMEASAGTEMYLVYTNLDQQQISDLQVSENGTAFTNVGEWDSSRSFEEKAGTCGILTRSDGYELCWGLGSYGRHTFTVQYRITNMVKGYADASGINQRFVNDFAQPIESVAITIRSAENTFMFENTGIWAGGTDGEIQLIDGEIRAWTTQGYQPGSFFGILVEFAEGMFSPGVSHNETFEEVKIRELEGTQYHPDSSDGDGAAGGIPGNTGGNTGSGFGFSNVFGILFSVLTAGIFPLVFILLIVGIFRSRSGASGSGSTGTGRMKPEYKNADYSRQLPWQGNLSATYTRLEELRALENDGVIIGAYLLRWVRSRQVELVKQEAGVFRNKEEDAIRLYAARPEMDAVERELYDMLVAAAGSDYVLQSKEFEKWSRKKYQRVDAWLTRYKNQGKQAMRTMGAIAEVPHKIFFGLVNTTRAAITPYGEQLTTEMFGFKRYLEDFTIINERQAREVQLWDEYLVYAQLFGIADTVAQQFRALYPDYFLDMARQMGYTNLDMFDIYMLSRISRNFGRAAYTGYRAGYNAARSSTGGGSGWSGGGGSFSGGGGGGFSGSSGGGGGGVR